MHRPSSQAPLALHLLFSPALLLAWRLEVSQSRSFGAAPNYCYLNARQVGTTFECYLELKSAVMLVYHSYYCNLLRLALVENHISCSFTAAEVSDCLCARQWLSMRSALFLGCPGPHLIRDTRFREPNSSVCQSPIKVKCRKAIRYHLQ